MTGFLRTLITSALIFALAAPAVGNAQFRPESARATLLSYIDALQTGDTQGLSALMTAELRNHHRALLNNEQYGNTLVSLYGSGEFSIEAIENTEDGKVVGRIFYRQAGGQPQGFIVGLVSTDSGDTYQVDNFGQ